MNRYTWRVKDQHPEATPAFPYAICDSKGVAIALVKTKADAQFIAEAARKISALESDVTRNHVLYLGQFSARRK